MAENKLSLNDEEFDVILPYIKDEMVTDINYNGNSLWIDHLEKGRYEVKDSGITESWIQQFTQKLSNKMNLQCNRSHPFIEAETDELRVSIIHEAVTNTGYSISIRKTPPIRRLSYDKMLEEEYCNEKIETFLANAVKCGFNIVVCGLPGTGKTEFVKYLTKYIPPYQKAITIEDNLEIRYRSINPDKDCVEIKVRDGFDHDQAIKLSLRQLPTWILLAETRGKEVIELLKALSTGTHCLTTLHTDTVRKVPERIKNMSKDVNANDIYMFLDLAVLIKSEVKEGQRIKRYIAEVGLIYHNIENGENKVIMIYENGKFINTSFPNDVLIKFKDGGFENPFIRRIDDYEKNDSNTIEYSLGEEDSGVVQDQVIDSNRDTQN